MLTALIFGTDRETTSHLQQLCSLTNDVCVFRTLERYPQTHETMRLLNSFAPQLVFLGVDDVPAAQAVEHDIRGIHPGTAILPVSANPQAPDSLDSPMGGVSVLSLPCPPDAFRAAIFHSLESKGRQKLAPVFVFQPAKAGSGSTTTALFVAHILSTLAEQKVLALECDLHAGPISMLCNFPSGYSIMDALEDSHRLTDENWARMVTRLGGIDVLPSVSKLGVRQVSAWGYQRLLSFARSRYDVIIADFPEVIDDATEVIARAAQAVFIVTAPSTPSLFLASRRRNDLETRGIATAKARFIVTRKSGDGALPREAGWSVDAEKIAAIPLDSNLMDASEFRVDLANAATIAELTKVAEFCCGRSLVPKRAGFRRFWLEGWLRGSSRAPELYSTAAR